jgi:hypothetical protein
LEANYATADTDYQVAAVQQQNENAAEVAKAKAAEWEKVLEKRADDEVKRQEALDELMANQAALLEEKELAEFDMKNLKENIQLESDFEKQKELAREYE